MSLRLRKLDLKQFFADVVSELGSIWSLWDKIDAVVEYSHRAREYSRVSRFYRFGVQSPPCTPTKNGILSTNDSRELAEPELNLSMNANEESSL